MFTLLSSLSLFILNVCVCTLRTRENWSEIPCTCSHIWPIELILILIMQVKMHSSTSFLYSNCIGQTSYYFIITAIVWRSGHPENGAYTCKAKGRSFIVSGGMSVYLKVWSPRLPAKQSDWWGQTERWEGANVHLSLWLPTILSPHFVINPLDGYHTDKQ